MTSFFSRSLLLPSLGFLKNTLFIFTCIFEIRLSSQRKLRHDIRTCLMNMYIKFHEYIVVGPDMSGNYSRVVLRDGET